MPPCLRLIVSLAVSAARASLTRVIFEEQREIDRAYVAFPIDLDDAVVTALDWALDRADHEWSKVNLRVAQRSVIADSPLLQDVERRGVKVSLEHRAGVSRLTRGPLIVYCPTMKTLAEAEEVKQATAIAVVGANPHLRPWVSAFQPQYLGGDAIGPARPLVADPVVWEAMSTFTTSINSSTGLTDSRDRSRVVDGLRKLRAAGHTFSPDELMAAALRLNWRGSAAWKLRSLATEINAGKQKRLRETYRSNIVQQWEADAKDRAASMSDTSR